MPASIKSACNVFSFCVRRPARQRFDLGVLLSSKIEETTIAGKKVFNVEDNYLIACFDDNVTEEVITEIAKQKPYYFVMRDSSMANDSVATNFEQIFAAYSPDTVRKVL